MTQRKHKRQPSSVSLEPSSCTIEKPWGWEIIWADGQDYTGKLIHIRAGLRLSLQYHDEKTETQCLISGSAMLVVEGADGAMHELVMQPRQGYTIQPFQLHRIVAIEDAEIIEVSTRESGVTVRVDDDYARDNETESMRGLPNRGWLGRSPAGARLKADGSPSLP
jgi:mannose-6-phosphate isomerase